MKKFLFLSLLLFLSGKSFLSAGVIATTQWKLGNKTVTTYRDDFIEGRENEERAHFDYLKKKVFNSGIRRARPLTILIDSNCVDDFAYYVYEIDRLTRNQSFLAMFNDFIGFPLVNNVHVQTIMPSNMPCVVDSLRYALNDKKPVFSEDFLSTLIEDLNKISFTDFEQKARAYIIAYTNEAEKDSEFYWFLKNCLLNLDQRFIKFKKNFHKSTEIFDEEYKERSIADIFFRSKADLVTGFSMQWLLSPLADATLVYKLMIVPHDFAVFVRCDRYCLLEDTLEWLGFVRDDTFFDVPEALNCENIAKSPIISVAMPVTLYDWMIKDI